MSEATRFEVMSYWEAKSIAQQVPMVLVSNVGQAASGIVSSILTAIAGASLDSLNAQVPSYLQKNGGLATLFKDLDIANVDNVIENELARDYSNIIIAMKAGIGQGVGGVHASLYETLTGTNALLGSYRSLIQRIAIDPYISRWANNLYTPNIPDAETAWFMKHIGAITGDQYKTYLAQAGWGSEFEEPLRMAWTRQAPIGIIFDMKRRGYIDDATVKTMLNWYRFDPNDIEQIAKLAVQYPEPYRLADFAAKDLINDKQLVTMMGYFGIQSDMAMSWKNSQRVFPSPETMMAMLRREIIDDGSFKTALGYSGYTTKYQDALLQLKTVIPPIQDLIRFAVREAYGEHDPEKQYSSMVGIANKMGLSAEAAEWYWYSHWDRIPITLMYANYYRGIWDKAKLERMLKIVDIHPDDRADIIGVAYQPPSIREQGYGYDVGAYTLDDIKRYRRWGGLSPEDADKAGQAMVAYRTEAERNSVRTEYVYAYGRGALTSEEFMAKLKDIKTPEEAIPLWMERADLYRDRVQKPQMDIEGKLVSSAEALSAFKTGLRNEEWTREALKALEWTDERIGVAIERAQRDMAETEKKEAEAKYRNLTLAQMQKLFRTGLLSKESFTTELVIIGYSPDDAELLTEIYTLPEEVTAKPKIFTSAVATRMYDLCIYDEEDLYDNFLDQSWDSGQAAMLTMYTIVSLEYPKLRTMYSKGAISGENFVKALVKLEMPEFNARQLVSKTYEELQVDRVSHEKDLTKAEIIKGVKNNVLTPSQGSELLQGIGYDENEAYYILAINKVVAAGDPEGYWEMRRVTENYKRARGEKALEIPDELIMLEKQINELDAQMKKDRKEGITEELLAEKVVKLGALRAEMKRAILGLSLK
jgi:hypothetical protein